MSGQGDTAKRAALNIRTTTSIKERLSRAAQENGRTLSQEADFRLEVSLLRDQEAGSRSAAALADFARLVASISENQTGKSWTDDFHTFARVSQALRVFLKENRPPLIRSESDLQASKEFEDAQAALDEAEEARRSARSPTARLDKERRRQVEEAYAAALAAYNARLERVEVFSEELNELLGANHEAASATYAELGELFRLRAKPPEANSKPGAQKE
jgi:hypothetical protein